MGKKPTYEELEQRIKELYREITTLKGTDSERLSHFRFLEIMDKIDQAIQAFRSTSGDITQRTNAFTDAPAAPGPARGT